MDITHVKGEDNAIADALSMAPPVVPNVSTIQQMPLLEFPTIAAAQASDSHLNDLLSGDTGLRLEYIPAPDGVAMLWCDTSYGTPRPYIPNPFRYKFPTNTCASSPFPFHYSYLTPTCPLSIPPTISPTSQPNQPAYPPPILPDPAPDSFLTPVIPSSLPQDPHPVTQPLPATPHRPIGPDLAPQPIPHPATPPPPQEQLWDDESAMPPEGFTSCTGRTIQSQAKYLAMLHNTHIHPLHTLPATHSVLLETSLPHTLHHTVHI
ncbi:hypothetical protein Pcinc_016632 [Petrolisthes cinctipes]|uniref:Uncharacterized protein n=1 Tax=Petrolisthes cinctipes TaxID=88211 RepID=A0AAE1FTB9_PETCI|nr:hypothetical protein Pcinc_016632 [Petrolisthes cinctipes]